VELAIYSYHHTSALVNSPGTSHPKPKLTLQIILGVRLLGLVVMHHLHDLQQVVLLQLRQRFRQLLHVDVARRLLLLLLFGLGRAAAAAAAHTAGAVKRFACGGRVLE